MLLVLFVVKIGQFLETPHERKKIRVRMEIALTGEPIKRRFYRFGSQRAKIAVNLLPGAVEEEEGWHSPKAPARAQFAPGG